MGTLTTIEGAQAAPTRKRRRRIVAALGVTLIRRSRKSGTTFLMRWADPVTGAPKQESLSRMGFDNEVDARAVVDAKARELAHLRAAIATGQAVTTRTTVPEAVKMFHKTRGAELATGTLTVYAEATTPFTAWAAREGVAHIEALRGEHLTAFRDWVIAQPAHAYAKKHKQKGKCFRVPGKRKRSPQTTNKILRAMRTVCGFWRLRGLLPNLNRDGIRDHLLFVKAPKPAPVFLRVPQIRKLLEACQRHDAELDDGKGHHHPPIMDFVVAALLTGCRFSELAKLEWEWCDLEAGEIRLPHTATKTGHARTIDLKVSPHLLTLLKRRKLAAGGNPYVFGIGRDVAEAARKRLQKDFASGKFAWHELRKTAGTFLTCAPGIYAGASAYLCAKRQGHSVTVSEKHYAGALTTIPATAATLEQAMEVDDLLPVPVAVAVKKGRAAQ